MRSVETSTSLDAVCQKINLIIIEWSACVMRWDRPYFQLNVLTLHVALLLLETIPWIHNITMREQSAVSIQSSLEPHLKEQSNVRRINSPYLIAYFIMGWRSDRLINLVRWFSRTKRSPSSGLADAAITYWCQQPAGCKLHCVSFVISAFLCLDFHIPHFFSFHFISYFSPLSFTT